MKKVSVLACVLLLTAAVLAQGPPSANAKAAASRSIIVVKLNGLSCTTAAGTNMFDALDWSWGASNASTLGTGGGGGSGKASISELVVQKKFDACSPVLFGAVTTGKNFPGLTLTQEDGTGNILLTVTLTNVLVTSWQIGGSTKSELPAESVGFDFEKVCISDTTTGNKACFDKVTNTAL